MPTRAIKTFRLDIQRANALVRCADSPPFIPATGATGALRSDILRSGWMFAVGAMDAYFCDAYADIIGATLISKSREPAVRLPSFVEDIELPVAALLDEYPDRKNWKWRMATRRMMADQNALRLSTIQQWFNRILPNGRRLFSGLIDTWITTAGATTRLFGVTGSSYAALSGPARQAACASAREAFETRFREIVRRRHDCIHTCDRPVSSPQRLPRAGTVQNVIRDIVFIVEQTETHLQHEFSVWLRTTVGFNPATVAPLGY
jgi:hypothetical protein